LEAIMKTLAPYNPSHLTKADLIDHDPRHLVEMLTPQSLWPMPGYQIDADGSEQLGDIARANACSHLLALRTDPPEFLALTLSAPQSSVRICSLLGAIALRYQDRGHT
jgi:hypothetical protein